MTRSTRGPRPILIVDDEQAIRRVLMRVLEHRGYATVCTHTGAQLLDLCSATQPSLVFLDVMMPEVDGIRALQRVQCTMGRWAPPTVMMSGGMVVEELEELVGAVAYLAKPFALTRVVELADHYASPCTHRASEAVGRPPQTRRHPLAG